MAEASREPYAVLCFGDSNTWGREPSGRRAGAARRWPRILENQLGANFLVVEEGLPCRTAAWDHPLEGRTRADRTINACLLAHHPLDIVVVMLGSDDVSEVIETPDAEIAAGIERISRIVLASEPWPNAGTPQLIVVSPPSHRVAESTRSGPLTGRPPELRLARRIQSIAQRLGCHFVDADMAVSAPRCAGRLLSTDGHRQLAEVLSKAVLERLDQSLMS